jgi:glycosyltransferase involved in cell wall biosynthesis
MRDSVNKYCVIIPTYESAKHLPYLLDRIKNISPKLKIIVVDDGSTDSTSKVLESFNQIVVIKHKINRGKGAALKSGINKAKELGFEYAITIDSDLQHSPDLIPSFIELQRKSNVDLIVGKREFSLKKMPIHRILSNTITSFLISLRVGTRVHDSQCGYRLIKIKDINTSFFRENGFQFESEFLIKMLLSGKKLAEIPIDTIYHKTGSYINNIKDTIKFIFLFFSSYFWT